tara:strand:- start:3160 stop:3453 length:294 start_codon:yes stop_codon:yes gene_type:complete
MDSTVVSAIIASGTAVGLALVGFAGRMVLKAIERVEDRVEHVEEEGKSRWELLMAMLTHRARVVDKQFERVERRMDAHVVAGGFNDVERRSDAEGNN